MLVSETCTPRAKGRTYGKEGTVSYSPRCIFCGLVSQKRHKIHCVLWDRWLAYTTEIVCEPTRRAIYD